MLNPVMTGEPNYTANGRLPIKTKDRHPATRRGPPRHAAFQRILFTHENQQTIKTKGEKSSTFHDSDQYIEQQNQKNQQCEKTGRVNRCTEQNPWLSSWDAIGDQHSGLSTNVQISLATKKRSLLPIFRS